MKLQSLLAIAFLVLSSCTSVQEQAAIDYENAVAAALLDPAAAHLATPTQGQIAWADTECSMFVHFSVATWEGREYDADGQFDLSKMNPEGFDAEAICAVAKSWGAGQIILVCKHVGGFCWWPTETTEYCVRNAAWKNGEGNLVQDVADACRRNGLKMGIYIYSDDVRYANGIGRGGRTDDPEKQDEWSALLRQQWTEVLTICGADVVNEIWFDGGCIVPLLDIINELAPNADIFAGPHETLRWPGTESGKLPYPCWSSVPSDLVSANGGHVAAAGDPDGDKWCPPECDTVLYGNGGHRWFWSPENEKLRHSVDQLMDIYLKSVGRGGVLLLNSSPNTDGEIPEGDVTVYREFGQAIERRFGSPIASTRAVGTTLELELDEPTVVNQIVTMEDLRGGHRIRGYVIEGRGLDGNWQELVSGISVGHKKIDVFHPALVDRMRLRITEHVGTPIVREFTVFYAPGAAIEEGAAPAPWVGCGEVQQGSCRLDLTAHIPMPASYAIRLDPALGNADITSATLLFNGEPMPEADCVVRDGVVYIRQTQQVTERTRTELLLEVQATEAGTAHIRMESQQ